MVYDKNISSWHDSIKFLFKLQKRLFKSTLVYDKIISLKLQKLILKSNGSRLIAIREVTQLSSDKKIPGIDGKTSLSFLERFELNEMLKARFNNWLPQSFKRVLVLKNNGITNTFNISTISDRAWQFLIKLAVEPAHEALFHPNNYGFRASCSLYDIQKTIFLNLNSNSQGTQKRILIIKLENNYNNFDYNYLLKKIIAPRSIKVGIFRFLKKGLFLKFEEQKSYGLISLLANILLDGIEDIHNLVRFGNSLVFFLKPCDDENHIVSLAKNFLSFYGLGVPNLNTECYFPLQGFDFLGWNFKIYSKEILSVPSFDNYQTFLKRIKHIINNSNYGSKIKISKLYPIIKEWRLYHKYCFMKSARFSLFFVKKRTFKIFNKESKQDFYSSKNLLDKTFYVLNLQDKNINISPYYGHVTFWKDSFFYKTEKISNLICIHCGMNSY